MIRHAHIVNTGRLGDGDFVSIFQPEAGSAVSDFAHQDDGPSPSRWQRIKRAVRTWLVDLVLRA